MTSESARPGTAPGAGTLGRGAATISIATAISRVTGFLRVIAVAAAMGATFLANTYQTANTAPNLVFELVAAGVLTSVFVPTFVDYLIKDQRAEGWRAANAMTSVALVVLVGIALVVALAAPLIMRLFFIGVEDDGLRDESVALGSQFLRLFAPQIIFYGAGMIMTGALHANRRFAMPAVAPIFNNIIVIGVYIAYMFMRSDSVPGPGAVSAGEIWLLGAGTTMGVVAMTICLLPGLRDLGWRFRFEFDPSHPAVKRAAKLGVWALGYAGGYQAGLIAVLILANRVEGGVAAYQWAYTFFYLPHALFGVPIFSVLFTAMAEHAARHETAGVVNRLRDGVGMLAFILFPVAAALAVLAGPLTTITLRYGVMTGEGAALVGRVLTAFAVGLPTYSAFLVFTRAFYALGDTKLPAIVNAGTTAAATIMGALLFFSLPEGWSTAGLALGHSIGFLVGCVVLGALLARRVGAADGKDLLASLERSFGCAVAAGAVMLALHIVLPDATRPAALLNLVVSGTFGTAAYLLLMARLRSAELASARALVKSLLSRPA
ncbi:MAG: murein biosynthesis integral membrane protein MurJ [Actinomycetota bacterium]